MSWSDQTVKCSDFGGFFAADETKAAAPQKHTFVRLNLGLRDLLSQCLSGSNTLVCLSV